VTGSTSVEWAGRVARRALPLRQSEDSDAWGARSSADLREGPTHNSYPLPVRSRHDGTARGIAGLRIDTGFAARDTSTPSLYDPMIAKVSVMALTAPGRWLR